MDNVIASVYSSLEAFKVFDCSDKTGQIASMAFRYARCESLMSMLIPRQYSDLVPLTQQMLGECSTERASTTRNEKHSLFRGVRRGVGGNRIRMLLIRSVAQSFLSPGNGWIRLLIYVDDIHIYTEGYELSSRKMQISYRYLQIANQSLGWCSSMAFVCCPSAMCV